MQLVQDIYAEGYKTHERTEVWSVRFTLYVLEIHLVYKRKFREKKINYTYEWLLKTQQNQRKKLLHPILIIYSHT